MKLNSDDKVIGIEPIIDRKTGTLLAITENGFGKRTELEEYRVQTRGGKGILTYKVTAKTGDIVGIKITDDEDDVMMITDQGVVIRIKANEISILGRNTQGVTLMRTNDGGKVVSIETIREEDEEGNTQTTEKNEELKLEEENQIKNTNEKIETDTNNNSNNIGETEQTIDGVEENDTEE